MHRLMAEISSCRVLLDEREKALQLMETRVGRPGSILLQPAHRLIYETYDYPGLRVSNAVLVLADIHIAATLTLQRFVCTGSTRQCMTRVLAYSEIGHETDGPLGTF